MVDTVCGPGKIGKQGKGQQKLYLRGIFDKCKAMVEEHRRNKLIRLITELRNSPYISLPPDKSWSAHEKDRVHHWRSFPKFKHLIQHMNLETAMMLVEDALKATSPTYSCMIVHHHESCHDWSFYKDYKEYADLPNPKYEVLETVAALLKGGTDVYGKYQCAITNVNEFEKYIFAIRRTLREAVENHNRTNIISLLITLRAIEGHKIRFGDISLIEDVVRQMI